MLRSMTLRDFRAFKKQPFVFSKINIFAGKNNSGKSSALSALNLFAQTIDEAEVGGSPLVLNGQYDQLGTFIDVVHGNLARRPLGFDFDYGDVRLSIDFKYRPQRREIDLQRFELDVDGREFYKYILGKDSFQSKIWGKDVESYFDIGRKVRPTFRSFWPMRVAPVSEIFEKVRSRSAGDDDLFTKYTDFQEKMSLSSARFNKYFTNFESISAFRDRPSRTYLYTGETPGRVGVTGSNTAQILAQDAARRGHGKGSLIDSISNWMSDTGIARALYVKSLTSRHFEICVVSNDGSEHNICDVGFGCSQVLPVLLGGLSLFRSDAKGSENRLLLVQEPEIHLHPNAQAELGSFFVDLAKRGGQLFIETHSDNLILRIASHVASGNIAASDVAIFWVGDDADHSVTNISITENGSFTPTWPGGFFPQRSNETTKLARAALRKNPGLATKGGDKD